VYQAVEKSSDSNVAVKFLRKSFQNHRDSVQRFVDEASLVARMKHPGIATLHGLGQSPQGGFFMVSDWYPNGDLSQHMRAGLIDVSTAANWVREAALVIQYVHEQGLLHCDLKPSNLLMDDQGHVVVTDFGLARSLSLDSNCSIEGTAGYMALEQALPGSSPLGPRTDVFGLGAVLYALLSGHPPYNGNRPSEILAKLLANHPIEPLSNQRIEVPSALEELCLQCLNRDPQHRPGSAGELAERLQLIAVP
jgi:serine/threonine protein kinase